MYFSARVPIATVSLILLLAASATCWDEAGYGCGVDPLLLRAIAWKESHGWTGAVGPKLEDGNRTLSFVQINTVYLSNLACFSIRREHPFDACISQKVGARILTDYVQRFGAIWKSVGRCYAGPTSTDMSAQVEYVRDMRRLYEGYRRQQTYQISTSPAQVVSFQGD